MAIKPVTIKRRKSAADRSKRIVLRSVRMPTRKAQDWRLDAFRRETCAKHGEYVPDEYELEHARVF